MKKGDLEGGMKKGHKGGGGGHNKGAWEGGMKKGHKGGGA